eukprot:13080798-Alexandrium_andersonii.AAC.1
MSRCLSWSGTGPTSTELIATLAHPPLSSSGWPRHAARARHLRPAPSATAEGLRGNGGVL